MDGNQRLSLSSSLRQIISGEGNAGPNVKLDSEIPPKVKAFIDKVIECPLEDLEVLLSGFQWEYNKGNFYHWGALFLYFDKYFKTYLSSRKDLLLEDTLKDDTPFPKQSVLQILRVMQIILENCHNKSSFDGLELEHFGLLLASTDPEILIATLETLSAFVKINPSKLIHASGKLVGCGSTTNKCLLLLAKGWEGEKEGLGLYNCVIENLKPRVQARSLVPSDIKTETEDPLNTVHSTLYLVSHGTNPLSMSVAHVVDLRLPKEDDLSLMKSILEESNVPPEHRFALFTRLRFAHAFCSPRICTLYSKICLLAFIVLVQASDSSDELVSFVANDPNYTNDLIRLVNSEEKIPATIRILALQALGSQIAAASSSDERARILSGSRISFADGNNMIFLHVLQREILSLNDSSDLSSDAFVEALVQFYLRHVISTSTSGRVIRESGMVPTLLSLLENSNPSHMHLVCLAVKTLQKLMGCGNSVVTLFKDLGGVDLLTNKLQIVVVRVIGSEIGDDSLMSVGESSNANLNVDSLYSEKRLIKVLLKALGSDTCAPENLTRPHGGHDVSLPATLSMIFKNANKFGGDVYSAAVTVMSKMIHKDPTCYASLDESGLPNAFLASVKAGVLPSLKAITCVPDGIGAICLNPEGLEAVKETSALRFLVDVLTDKKYVIPMNDHGIVPLANAVEELLGDWSSLRDTGMDMIIEIINTIASLEDDKGNATASGSEGICDEEFIQLCIFRVMVLVHKTMMDAETCRLFVEKAGIEALLKLVLRPSIIRSSQGMLLALNSTMVFESFTQDHSAPLARAICLALREYLKSTLDGFHVLSGSYLLDPKATPPSGFFSSLFFVKLLLFLAASKDNIWLTALLQEFGNENKDVLESIGKTHREILWQIALLEDSQFENEDDNGGSGSGAGSCHSESNTSESEEQRFNSFRQFLNLLTDWSFESVFSQSGPRETDKQRSYYASCCDMLRSLSLQITQLFQELGKKMLLPARRRDVMVTVTPASKSVASAFAAITFDHMNFKGHVKPSGSVASWSSKCRYLGKVVDFIDGILLEKPDTYNPVLLNFLYGLGVIQSVLTNFEALFRVSRTPASPMETDEGAPKPYSEETVCSLINGPLVSYGKLMDHLVTDDIAYAIFQSSVLKAVCHVWSHPQFIDCNDDFIATVISIIRHLFSRVSVSNTGSRSFGPPPNETSISTIMKMGFTRARSEEALRQVGSNSVELAMKCLFSHPGEVTEDDELARSIAMCLGNSETDANGSSQPIEDETVQLPTVDDLLSSSKKLIEMKDSLVFPVRDLLSMICSQDDGRYRSYVISYLLEQVKLCSANSDVGKNNMLSSLFHVLAFILNEDKDAREVASKSGLVKVAADLLSDWNTRSNENGTVLVPKWATAAFLAVDRLAQVYQKLNRDSSELLKKDDGGNQNSIVIDDETQNNSQPNSGISSKHIDVDEQKRFVEISCGFLGKPLPAETTKAVLQLCSTLTSTHSVADSFLDAGGLPLLLSLPASSLFVGFDNVAATIIRNILEDPQTPQQAMENDIKYSVVTAYDQRSNAKLTPRKFLQNLRSVISWDPVMFMQAVRDVCQIVLIGERPYVFLLKDGEKDRSKEKEKDEKDKPPTSTDGHVTLGSTTELPEAYTKNTKAHRKPPQSFTTVIELLLESVITFVPPSEDKSATRESSSVMDMDIDVNLSKGKGKAIASGSDEIGESGQESSASLAKVAFILKLLKEMLLMYGPSVNVLLRKDAELITGIFHHVLCKFLPHLRSSKYEKKDADWSYKLAGQASQFLVASCVCSTEARRRIFMEINNAITDFVDNHRGNRPPGSDIHAFVDLLGDVLAARSPTGALISGEALVTFIDVGLMKSLTQTMQLLDLDHADSLKIVPGLVKVLELVTKEHFHASEANSATGENMSKPYDQGQHGETENTGDISRSTETVSLPNASSASTEVIEHFSTVQKYGVSEAVTDDMEHDQDIDGGFVPPSKDDYMHESSEETRGQDEDVENNSGDKGDEVDKDEDSCDDGHNDLKYIVVGDLPHHQDDHRIEDELVEDDVGGVIFRLGEETNGINLLDRIEGSGTPCVMPDDVFGSGRQSRTTSNYHLLRRSGESYVPSQRLLLLEPSSCAVLTQSQTDSAREGPLERNLEPSSSQLDSIFQSLRNGHHGQPGHRLSMWNDDPQSGGSNASSIPSGLEGYLVSHLRRPTPEKSSDQDKAEKGQTKNESSQSEESAGMVPEPTTHNIDTGDQIGSHDSGSIPTVDEPHGVNDVDAPVGQPQSAHLQSNQNDGVSHDFEAVSQEHSGSGAYGHDDGGQRQGQRRTDVPLGTTSIAVGDASLHSITEDSENPSHETDQSDAGQDGNRDGATGSGSGSALIDPSGRQGPVAQPTPNSEPQNDVGIHPEILATLTPYIRAKVLAELPAKGDPCVEFSKVLVKFPSKPRILPLELIDLVILARKGPVAQPTSNSDPQNDGDIDPEFLAALPPYIRAEVLAQHQAHGFYPPAQEWEGHVKMNVLSIRARFPSDLREEVHLKSSDTVLANLSPFHVELDKRLREYYARIYKMALFGMLPRSRQGESSRRGEQVGSGMDRAGAIIACMSRSKPIKTDGASLVDEEDVKAIIRLLRVVQPLCKPQLQRLLLKLCAHAETLSSVVKILMDLLMLDIRKPDNNLSTSEPSYRLYDCQSHVMYSRPYRFDDVMDFASINIASDTFLVFLGVPPSVSLRVLETLSYLARNHTCVAKLLLQFRLPPLDFQIPTQSRGKAIMGIQEELVAITMLLSLLSHPLYLKSIAHLEELLILLDVIIDKAKSKQPPAEHGVSVTEESPAKMSILDENNVGVSDKNTKSSKAVDACKASSSGAANRDDDSHTILLNLPQAELRLLCSLLARESLSDKAYALVVEVLKKLVTIAPRHSHLFITELAGAIKTLTKSAMDELHRFRSSEINNALITTTDSGGAAILRVLQALSSLVASLAQVKDQTFTENDQTATLSLVGDINSALQPLWTEFSACISNIEIYSDKLPDISDSSMISSRPSGAMPVLPARTRIILPYIESFFVMCEILHPGNSGGTQEFGANIDEATTSGSFVKADEKKTVFVKFLEKHRKLLNVFIRQNLGLLEKSFSFMLKVQRFIDFDNKRSHFRSKIKHQHDHHHSPLRISVRRESLLEDSYNQLIMRSTQDLKGRLRVDFLGEEGIDLGGLTREWYQILSRVITDKKALLFTTVGNHGTFQPNPNSVHQADHLSYFKFVGRVVGKALFDGHLLDVHFTRSFYKHILGAKVTYHDIEAIDPGYFKNLKWMLENDISDILDLTFSIDADEEKMILCGKSEVTDYELMPGGRNIQVTEKNKHEYVNLLAEHRLTTAIRPQINAFLEGFNELIPRDLIYIFHDKELELLISGLPDIDLDDMKENTEYSGYSAASPVIQWFWEVAQGFSKDDKARLLQFVTGTSKVPLEGFSALQGMSRAQKFQIHKAYESPDHFPSSHTCFNQLDLPEYPSKEHLEERLLFAIHEANEGFGLG